MNEQQIVLVDVRKRKNEGLGIRFDGRKWTVGSFQDVITEFNNQRGYFLIKIRIYREEPDASKIRAWIKENSTLLDGKLLLMEVST